MKCIDCFDVSFSGNLFYIEKKLFKKFKYHQYFVKCCAKTMYFNEQKKPQLI